MVDLAALRESLRKIAPGAIALADAPGRNGLPTGFPALDAALGGGFPIGAVSEIHGAPSSGKTAVALTALATYPGLAVYIDGGHQFFPPAAAALGVALDRVLLVRPRASLSEGELAAAAAAAAEIVARSGAFGLIVIDLPAGTRLLRSPAARVRGAMQRAAATALVIGASPGGPVFDGARVRLAVRGGRGRIDVAVEKGGRGGVPATVELRPTRARLDERPGAPVAPATARLAPGIERTAAGGERPIAAGGAS